MVSCVEVELPHSNFLKGDHIPHEQMPHPGERVQVDVKVVPRKCIFTVSSVPFLLRQHVRHTLEADAQGRHIVQQGRGSGR